MSDVVVLVLGDHCFEVLHFLLGAERRVTSIFLDGIVIPPAKGRHYAGRA